MTDQPEEPPTAVTTTEQPSEQTIEETTKKMQNLTTSFTIWPPSQRTRDAVTKRLIQTLTDKSVLSDRYGTVPADEAAGFARTIEEEAFNAVPGGTDGGEDGVEILQAYSKEISKRMLDFVKSRSVESVNVVNDVKDKEKEEEEGSSVEA